MMPPFQPVGANTWVYLRGKWTVTLEDVYDPVTCATRNSTTALTTAELSRRTGLNITDKSGKPGNLATMTSSTFDQVNFMVNMPGNNPIPTSAYPNPNNATLMKLVGTSPWWEFQLLTASLGGHPMICNNGAEVFPNAKVPAMPGQFYYQPSSTSPGICTTASNANLPFPPYKGVLIIVLSWFFSPVLTGVASAIIFLLSRHLVLRSVNAYKRSFMVLPPMAFLTFWVNIYFVFTKGAAKVLSRDASGWTPVRAAWIAAACAGSISFFSIIVVIPLLYRRINTVYQKRDDDAAALKVAELEAAEDLEKATAAKAAASENNEPTKEGDAEDGVVAMAAGEVSAPANNMEKLRGYLFKARNAAMHGLEVDVHNLVEEDELVAAIHANAEMFDEKAETVFACACPRATYSCCRDAMPSWQPQPAAACAAHLWLDTSSDPFLHLTNRHAGLFRHLRYLLARRGRGGLHVRPTGCYFLRYPLRQARLLLLSAHLDGAGGRIRPHHRPRHVRLLRHARRRHAHGQAHSQPRFCG
jgi:hypothetical protein